MEYHITDQTIIENYVLHIRSKDALNNGAFLSGNDFRTHFSINLKQKISKKEDELFKVIIQSAQIPYTFYNTNENNNYIDWEENGVLKTPLQIAVGNYNILELINEIKTDMNTNSSFGASTYDITYSGITNKITITSTNANNTKLLFNSGVNTLKSIAKQIGYTLDNDITFNSGSNSSSNSVVNLLSIHSLFIRSNVLSSLNILSSYSVNGGITNTDILTSIPITADPLSMIYYQYYEGMDFSIVEDETISYMDFKMTDQNANLINLQPQINWEMVISIQIIKNPIFRLPKMDTNFNKQILDDIPYQLKNQYNQNPLNTEGININEIVLNNHQKNNKDILDDYKTEIEKKNS
tara:strand:- start:200 stop:1255 length:1056 start_codon:yes stop_codon:yes gene_type:complete